MRLSIVLAGAALLSATTAYIEDADDEFDLPYSELADLIERTLASDFDHGPPSTDQLYWFPCLWKKFSCAMLRVPLDYENASSPFINTTWIKKATYNEWAQDILINPGGPGVSGVLEVVAGYEDWSEKLGTQYNIIGFDPRGVGFSAPDLDCGTNGGIGKLLGRPGLSAPFQEQYQFANVFGKHCTRVNTDTNAKCAGTVATAHDMMHFVKLRHLRPGNKPKSSASTRDTELDEARLWYYGTSYGTLLGQTLAALFPDQIGRMILDGNVDGIQHYTGVQPADVDATDAAFHEFFAKCFAAGPEKCAYHNDAASVDEIENRYVILLRDLRTMPAIWDMASDYGVLTADVVASIMFRAMYSPLDTWEQLAVFLRAMQDGRPIEAFEAASSILRGHLQAPAKRKSPDAMQIITCLDADEKFAMHSFDDFIDAREVYQKESFFFGNQMSLGNLLLCVGMNLTPPSSQRFPGFNMSGTHTSTPILFLNPTRDPITPISSAAKMSKLFPGSAVLPVDSTGHSTFSTASLCIDRAVKYYLDSGVLPLPGTVCRPDVTTDAYFGSYNASKRMLTRELKSPIWPPVWPPLY